MKRFHRLVFFLVLVAGAERSRGGVSWPEEQLLPRFAQPNKLEVVDLLDQPGEVRLMMATLQGLVNREEPRLYLFEPASEGKETWLRDLGVPFEIHDDPFALVARFKASAKGLVVYDPDFSDSVNVATTLAGQRDALVASPELAERLRAEPFGLPVLEDLRGRFRSRIEAYRWQYEHLWKSANRRLLVGLSPGRTRGTRDGLPGGYEEVGVDRSGERGGRNRAVREFDLSRFAGGEAVFLRFEDARRRDGWGVAVHRVVVEADGKAVAEFVPGTEAEKPFLHDPQRSQLSRDQGGFRFGDVDRHFTYRFPLPEGVERVVAKVDLWNQFRVSAGASEPRMPWSPFGHLRDYAVANRAMVFWLDANAPAERELMERIMDDAGRGTPYLGWFGNDIEGEFGAVELASRHGVYVVPADWFNNLTVFGGTRIDSEPARPRPAPRLQDKIYVTLTFGEGDNLQYNQHHMRRLWDDPARGEVPINWTSSPLLLDAAPAILNHYRKTATPNDRIIAGPSGVGYFYAKPWPEDHFADFLGKTRPYIEKSGMRIPYVLSRVNHRDVPLGPAKAAAYRDRQQVPGILLGWGERFGLEVVDGVPVSQVRGIGSIREGVQVLQAEKRNWDGKAPKFLSVGLFAWRLAPSDVVRIVKTLGPEFEVVDADQYFALAREHHGLQGPVGRD